MSDPTDVPSTIAGWLGPKAHIWVNSGLVIALIVRAFRRRKWPTAEEVIELLAYGAGLYGATWMADRSIGMTADEQGGGAWVLMGAALAVALVSARGIHRTLTAPVPATGVVTPVLRDAKGRFTKVQAPPPV